MSNIPQARVILSRLMQEIDNDENLPPKYIVDTIRHAQLYMFKEQEPSFDSKPALENYRPKATINEVESLFEDLLPMTLGSRDREFVADVYRYYQDNNAVTEKQLAVLQKIHNRVTLGLGVR